MTVQEALQSVLLFEVSQTRIDKALIDGDLAGADEYTRTDKTAVDTAALNVLTDLLSAPDVSEGGLSIRYDRTAITKRIAELKTGLGISDAPVINCMTW